MTPTQRRLGAGLTTAFVFLGACLMFGVEPLIGRLLLPYFGGAAHVWLTCMVLFQGLLLAGYAWAHGLAARLGAWHLALFAVPVLVLPLDLVAEPSADAPLLSITLAVLRAIGLPFLAMSTVSVVAQLWWARSPLGETSQPYPLYAASNAGSLVALLAYPLLVEPNLGLTAQRWAWTAGYLVLVALSVASYLALKPRRGSQPVAPEADRGPQPTWGDRAWWLTLSAVPSAFLLATTNVIAGEVGSFPLVWVVPLALYLGSFMVVFRDRGGVPRWIGAVWPELLALSAVVFMFGVSHLALVVLHALALLLVAVLLHGELYERRPAPARLTSFYLWMSVGGFVGGSLVTFGAPYMFPGNWEYPLLLVAIVVVVGVLRGRRVLQAFQASTLPLVATRLTVLMGAAAVVGVGAWSFAQIAFRDLAQYRTFYGVFRVRDMEDDRSGKSVRYILHGATLHGSQVLDDELRMVPSEYYHPSQCIAEAFEQVPSPRRIGIVGLGAGALSGFSRTGDQVDFYEIDPKNEEIARRWFTWLDQSPGKLRVIVGDGRLELATRTETYDYLQMDAFSGDGIPVHLINREALQVYGQRLAPDGLLMLHVSNRYYDLRPVVKSTSALDGWSGAFAGPRPAQVPLSRPATCVVLARDPARLQGLVDKGWTRFGADDGLPDLTPWTDDYVNMLDPLLRGRPKSEIKPR
jgi:SAM-dependent methyltransferase